MSSSKIKKTHKKSFFIRSFHNSITADNLFSNRPTYKDDNVVVLQVIYINDPTDSLIFEIVEEMHYNQS